MGKMLEAGAEAVAEVPLEPLAPLLADAPELPDAPPAELEETDAVGAAEEGWVGAKVLLFAPKPRFAA